MSLIYEYNIKEDSYIIVKSFKYSEVFYDFGYYDSKNRVCIDVKTGYIISLRFNSGLYKLNGDCSIGLNAQTNYKKATYKNNDLVLLAFSEYTCFYGIIVENKYIYTDYRPLLNICHINFLVLKDLDESENKIRTRLIKNYKSNIVVNDIKLYHDILDRPINFGDTILCDIKSSYKKCIDEKSLILANRPVHHKDKIVWSNKTHLSLNCYKLDDFEMEQLEIMSESPEIFNKKISIGDLVILNFSEKNIIYGVVISENEALLLSGEIRKFFRVIKREKDSYTLFEKDIYNKLVEKLNIINTGYVLKSSIDLKDKELGSVYMLKNKRDYAIYLGAYKLYNPLSTNNIIISKNNIDVFDLYLVLDMSKAYHTKLYNFLLNNDISLDKLCEYIMRYKWIRVYDATYGGLWSYKMPNILKINQNKKIESQVGKVNIIGIGDNICLNYSDDFFVGFLA